MRPPAIVHFEILFVISIVFSAVVSMLTWDDYDYIVEFSFEITLVAEILAAALYIALTLWASRGGSNVARWIIVLCTVVGFMAIYMVLPDFNEMRPIMAFSAPAYAVLKFAAIYFLFSSDARTWFENS